MTDLKKMIRKVKFDYADSVFNWIHGYNYYKQNVDGRFSLTMKYWNMNTAMKNALREHAEYMKWKERAKTIRSLSKITIKWYKYLIGGK